MIEWLMSLCGFVRKTAQHRCEEFTQWEAWSNTVSIVASNGEKLPDERQYEVTEYWQQRRCTLCGWIQQQPLRYDAIEDEDDGNA